MVSLENDQATSRSIEPISGPRISFSTDFLDDKNFISISPHSNSSSKVQEIETEKEKVRNVDFEFLSNDSPTDSIVTADELIFDGKLLPFWQMQNSEKLNKISLKPKEDHEQEEKIIKKEEESSRISWFDEDPSPRPPKCTLLWKELLRLKKQRAASTLSPSSSSSSSSSSSNSNMDVSSMNDGKASKGGIWNREKHVKRIKKGLERTRSASIRIKPVLNMPICSQGRSTSALPPLFHYKFLPSRLKIFFVTPPHHQLQCVENSSNYLTDSKKV